MAASPLPVQPESPSMPADAGFRLHDNQRGSPIRPQPGKANPKDAISSIQKTFTVTLGTLQNQELMTQRKNLGLQNSTGPETISQEKSRINMALAAYTPRLRKRDDFNKNGILVRTKVK